MNAFHRMLDALSELADERLKRRLRHNEDDPRREALRLARGGFGKGGRMPQHQGFGHVTLTVNDLERSADFYNRVLGLRWGWCFSYRHRQPQ
jgi:glyoxalase/bleomycin resistance protein/dioxygenase superfamily protein